MKNANSFLEFSPCTLADLLSRDLIMDNGIRPLYQNVPRIAGPAFTVRCGPGDNLMLHAAIYRAPAGSVIVVESADLNYAVAGGNVCAVAQKNGIAGFVIDGVIRDMTEIRELQFPVFSRGVIPIPGGKNKINTLNDKPVRCGGVQVNPGDIVVADEEGIVVIPLEGMEEILVKAKAKVIKESSETLETWEKNHRAKIDAILKEKGFNI
jgi:4-hydroxy-4-methyl-2-oxoglutarate aldolase